MAQIDRGDGLQGSINARVEPSVRLPSDGIYMEVNDHFIVGSPDETLSSELAMNILAEQWPKSIERSEWIIDQIMALKGQVK